MLDNRSHTLRQQEKTGVGRYVRGIGVHREQWRAAVAGVLAESSRKDPAELGEARPVDQRRRGIGLRTDYAVDDVAGMAPVLKQQHLARIVSAWQVGTRLA